MLDAVLVFSVSGADQRCIYKQAMTKYMLEFVAIRGNSSEPKTRILEAACHVIAALLFLKVLMAGIRRRSGLSTRNAEEYFTELVSNLTSWLYDSTSRYKPRGKPTLFNLNLTYRALKTIEMIP
ncbi:hypothetical protein M514_00724 [Trichuris suis]|uniref:Uncharacterized protein n=1 Tax=Trichuris suis TaxID=68888 RepID=A0A085MMQ2_9BILA|nr:hypothetical protein M513_00724 [Trichuris suis]KFD65127.1 hypothetical protein M514_00724 [Trichuris suis]